MTETVQFDRPGGWNLPFDPQILETPICFAFTSRGNDIYWQMAVFLLNQTNVFRNMSILAALSLWGPAAEELFRQVAKLQCEYVCIVDSDVAPTVETVVRMLLHQKDIVTCPTLMYDGGSNDIHFNVHDDPSMRRIYSPKDPSAGLEKVFNTSWACVLIHKRVIDMFIQTKQEFTKWSDMLPPEAAKLPPDSLFFEKAKLMGFDIWMDWSLEYATHHKYVALNAQTCETWIHHRLYDMSEEEHLGRAARVLSRRTAPVAH